jgi:hypothetical protein
LVDPANRRDVEPIEERALGCQRSIPGARHRVDSGNGVNQLSPAAPRQALQAADAHTSNRRG